MRYELNIPAINCDVIPLRLVADAMAKAAATAYGKTPSHKPIFDYQLPLHVKSLLKAAHAGQLQVCNQVGCQGTAEEIIADAKSSGNLSEVRRCLVKPDWEKLRRDNPPVVEGVGVWNFSGINLGPTEIDWDKTNILCLYSKLHHLNEWGKTRGDEFSIADECSGWVDERGYMNPKSAFLADTTAGKGEAVPGMQSELPKPWLIADPRDPEPVQPWYTSARYFARQLVVADSTLLTKLDTLAGKTVQSLTNAGILKRGGNKPFDPGTVKKAFSNVSLG